MNLHFQTFSLGPSFSTKHMFGPNFQDPFKAHRFDLSPSESRTLWAFPGSGPRGDPKMQMVTLVYNKIRKPRSWVLSRILISHCQKN